MVACGFVLFKVDSVSLMSFLLACLGLKTKFSIVVKFIFFFDKGKTFASTTFTRLFESSANFSLPALYAGLVFSALPNKSNAPVLSAL